MAPYCENWSYQVHGPIPTAKALQWDREMVKKQVLGKDVYFYHRFFDQTIGFVKITKEYDKDGVFAGSRHFVEGIEVPGVDYEQFFQRISENLPDWVFYYIAPKNKDNPFEGPALLNKGVKTFIGG